MEGKLERSGDAFTVRLSAEDVCALGLSEGQTVEVNAKTDPTKPFAGLGPAAGRRIVDGLPVYTIEEMVAEARRLGPEFEPPSIDWGPDRGSEIIDDDDPR